MTNKQSLESVDLDLLERVRSAAELLESIEASRGLLDQLPAEDRERLHLAVAQFTIPIQSPGGEGRKPRSGSAARRKPSE